jgi:hypothetical protein
LVRVSRVGLSSLLSPGTSIAETGNREVAGVRGGFRVGG